MGEQIIQGDLYWHCFIIDIFWIFFLEIAEDITYAGDFNIVLHFLVPVDDDELTVFALLVFLAVFFKFLFSVVVGREEGGDDGGLFSCLVEFGSGGV